MFERFTQRAREVVSTAETEAATLGHAFIGTEHLLLGMLRIDGSVAQAVLNGAGLTYDQVRDEICRIVGPGQLGPEDAEALSSIGIDLAAVRAKVEESFGPDALGGAATGRRRFALRSKKVIELSLREAIRLHHRYIGTEHLLLGLIREGEGVGAKAIVNLGVGLSDLRDATIAEISRAA